MLYLKAKSFIFDKIRRITSIISKIVLRLNGSKVGKGFKCYGIPVIKNTGGEIVIGNNVRMNSAIWGNPIGYYPRICLQVQPNALIEIGNDVGMSCTAITAFKGVSIGNRVLIGAGCKIYDSDFHPLDAAERYENRIDSILTKKVFIHDDVFIGAGTIILKGAEIGEGSIIGAGSVVSGKIPPKEIWAGNPAKFIKKL